MDKFHVKHGLFSAAAGVVLGLLVNGKVPTWIGTGTAGLLAVAAFSKGND